MGFDSTLTCDAGRSLRDIEPVRLEVVTDAVPVAIDPTMMCGNRRADRGWAERRRAISVAVGMVAVAVGMVAVAVRMVPKSAITVATTIAIAAITVVTAICVTAAVANTAAIIDLIELP